MNGTDGDQPLTLSSAKGSGELTNIADMQLNVWRPNIKKAVDDTMTVYAAKNKHNVAKYLKDLQFNAEHFELTDKGDDVYQQAAEHSNKGYSKEALEMLSKMFGGLIASQVTTELRQ